MYEKLVTFEEEKRKEHLYLLFNSIFVCACLICVFEVVFKAPFLLTQDIANESVKWVIETLLRPLCISIAVLLPFFVYNVRQQTPFRNKLRPEVNKVSPVYYFLGIISVASAVPFFVYIGELFSSYMISEGYVINEIYPSVGQGIGANVFYTLYTSAVTAVFFELAFRGVVAEKFSRAHIALALIIPSLISSLYTFSFIRIPYLFVTSLIISWCYLKTHSLYLSMSLNFTASVSFNIFYVMKINYTSVYESNVQFVALVSIVICLVAFIALAVIKGANPGYPEPKDEDEAYERLSGKESLIGILKSFAFWIMLFIFMFQLLFTYLDKPMRNTDGNNVVYEQYSKTE